MGGRGAQFGPLFRRERMTAKWLQLCGLVLVLLVGGSEVRAEDVIAAGVILGVSSFY